MWRLYIRDIFTSISSSINDVTVIRYCDVIYRWAVVSELTSQQRWSRTYESTNEGWLGLIWWAEKGMTPEKCLIGALNCNATLPNERQLRTRLWKLNQQWQTHQRGNPSRANMHSTQLEAGKSFYACLQWSRSLVLLKWLGPLQVHLQGKLNIWFRNLNYH